VAGLHILTHHPVGQVIRHIPHIEKQEAS
jgi:hypothetical protein